MNDVIKTGADEQGCDVGILEALHNAESDLNAIQDLGAEEKGVLQEAKQRIAELVPSLFTEIDQGSVWETSEEDEIYEYPEEEQLGLRVERAVAEMNVFSPEYLDGLLKKRRKALLPILEELTAIHSKIEDLKSDEINKGSEEADKK